MAAPIGRLHLLTNGQRVQQTAVEVHGNQAVKKPGRLLGQRILIGPKRRQGVLTKPVKLALCRLRGHRPAKGRQISGVIGEMRRDHLDDLFRDVVKRGLWPLRYLALAPPAGAVVGIVVPLATLGLVGVHQEPIALAHVAIEILHAQLFAPGGPV